MASALGWWPVKQRLAAFDARGQASRRRLRVRLIAAILGGSGVAYCCYGFHAVALLCGMNLVLAGVRSAGQRVN